MGTKNILLEVEKNIKIIPEVYANDGYKLFKELSNIIHVNKDEELALKKYEAFKSLVVGLLDKIKNDKQYLSACKLLGI